MGLYISKDKLDSLAQNTMPKSIIFNVAGNDMLRLEESGDIYVKGKLVEDDKEVVDALREFVLKSKN